MKQSNYYNNIAESYDRTRWLTKPVADFIEDLVSAMPITSFLDKILSSNAKFEIEAYKAEPKQVS